jgi:hypothetical protein
MSGSDLTVGRRSCSSPAVARSVAAHGFFHLDRSGCTAVGERIPMQEYESCVGPPGAKGAPRSPGRVVGLRLPSGGWPAATDQRLPLIRLPGPGRPRAAARPPLDLPGVCDLDRGSSGRRVVLGQGRRPPAGDAGHQVEDDPPAGAMELPGDGSWWVVGADAASATVVANDGVVVARIVADTGVKYLVGERLSGWRLSSLATAQATHDHDGGD